jgi:hypothetical protein
MKFVCELIHLKQTKYVTTVIVSALHCCSHSLMVLGGNDRAWTELCSEELHDCNLLGCDAMSVGTRHDMTSHPRSLKSAALLLSQPPISYGLYCLVAGYREWMGRNSTLQTT